MGLFSALMIGTGAKRLSQLLGKLNSAVYYRWLKLFSYSITEFHNVALIIHGTKKEIFKYFKSHYFYRTISLK